MAGIFMEIRYSGDVMKSYSTRRAFTLIEMLLVIAMISILASLVISNFTNSAQDTRRLIARQQVAVLQEAVNAWVNKQSATRINGGPQAMSDIQAAYNAAPDMAARYALVSVYLDEDARTDGNDKQFVPFNNKLATRVMRDLNNGVELNAWTNGSVPKVEAPQF
jgi:prepilin-type N-terminal cleavage/methylation domain-containing protein